MASMVSTEDAGDLLEKITLDFSPELLAQALDITYPTGSGIASVGGVWIKSLPQLFAPKLKDRPADFLLKYADHPVIGSMATEGDVLRTIGDRAERESVFRTLFLRHGMGPNQRLYEGLWEFEDPIVLQAGVGATVVEWLRQEAKGKSGTREGMLRFITESGLTLKEGRQTSDSPQNYEFRQYSGLWRALDSRQAVDAVLTCMGAFPAVMLKHWMTARVALGPEQTHLAYQLRRHAEVLCGL